MGRHSRQLLQKCCHCRCYGCLIRPFFLSFPLFHSVNTVFSRAMASSLPIPIPPRTPTPPSDDPPDGPTLSEATSYEHLNTARLSPLVDTFPLSQSPSDAGSRDRLSPTKSSFGTSPVESVPENGVQEDASGPFNFQTVTLAKSPIAKSVSLSMTPM